MYVFYWFAFVFLIVMSSHLGYRFGALSTAREKATAAKRRSLGQTPIWIESLVALGLTGVLIEPPLLSPWWLQVILGTVVPLASGGATGLIISRRNRT